MPSIVRQRIVAPKAAVRPSLNGSIASRFVPVSQLEDEPVHLLLYGVNRTGKTTLACQFPKPLGLISLESVKSGGAKSIKKIAGVEHVVLRSSADVEQLGREFLASCPFQTVVVDSATSLNEIILAEVCGWSQTAELLTFNKVHKDQYTEVSERLRRVLRPYVDLDRHVVICANEKDHNPSEDQAVSRRRKRHEESLFGAAMGQGAFRWLADSMDVCQLYFDKETKTERTVSKIGKEEVVHEEEVETGRIVRRLRTQLHPNYLAGLRSEHRNVPEFVQADSPEEMYAKFMSVVKGTK